MSDRKNVLLARGLRLAATALLLVTAAACSGDGTSNTDTVYTGIVLRVFEEAAIGF